MSSRWCPKCGAEYREGFSECADCGVALVDEAPAPKPHRRAHEVLHGPFSPGDDTVELMWTNPLEAEVIVARLQSEGIPAVVFGDSPYGNGPMAKRSVGVRVVVRRADLAIASALTTDERSPQPDETRR